MEFPTQGNNQGHGPNPKPTCYAFKQPNIRIRPPLLPTPPAYITCYASRQTNIRTWPLPPPFPMLPANLKEEEKEILENDQVDKDNQDESSVMASRVPPKPKYEYQNEQWSPINTSGKKQYDRNFLLQLQFQALTMMKPEGLPDLEIIKDKVQLKPLLVQKGNGTSNKKIEKGKNAKEKDAEVNELVEVAGEIVTDLTASMIQFRNLPINSPNQLYALISLIFDKALEEPSFNATYAQLCMHLQNSQTANNEEFHFKTILLIMCKKKIEKDNMELTKEKLKLDIEIADSEAKKKELTEQLAKTEKAIKIRTFGNIRFIGELYKLQMLSGRIIVECIKKLIHSKDDDEDDDEDDDDENDDEDSIECLCHLLTNVGKTLNEEGKSKTESNLFINDCLDGCFTEMRRMISCKSTSSRIRFMMQDVMDLRQVNWKKIVTKSGCDIQLMNSVKNPPQ